MNKTLLFSVVLAGIALAGCNKSTRTSTSSTDTTTPTTDSSLTSTTAPAPTPDMPLTSTTPTPAASTGSGSLSNPPPLATTSPTDPASVSSRLDSAANRASDSFASGAASASSALSSAANSVGFGTAHNLEWRLSAGELQADLDANNPVIRTRTSAMSGGGTRADKAAVKAGIESKFKADSELAALKLDVDADKDGSVTLEGKAHSAEQIGHAIGLALDTDGVNKVTSKIKLDKNARVSP